MDNIIKSHATAYHLYKDNYYDKFGGKISITFNSRFFFSMINDNDLVDYAMQFWVYKTIYNLDDNDKNIKQISNSCTAWMVCTSYLQSIGWLSTGND